MKTLSKNEKHFFEVLDEAVKYLIILDNELFNWDDLKEEYEEYDEDDTDWKAHRYHEMVVAMLDNKKYKKDLWESYGLKSHGVHDFDDDWEDDMQGTVIQLRDKYFQITYYGRHYFGEIKEVYPENRVVYIPIDKQS